MSRTYTDDERVAALAALTLNSGNLSKTARDTGIPIATVSLWRNSAAEAMLNPSAAVESEKADWSQLYGYAAALGGRLIAENLERYRGRDLKPHELRDVAVVSGIAVDKHLDYRDGRKSAVNIDQSQNLNLPAGTTLDDLKALRDGLQA